MPDIFKQTPCNKKICNTSNVWFNHEDIVINCFYDKEAKSQKKNETKIKVSNLLKQKLWHMDAYDGAATEQQVELSKTTWNLPRIPFFLHAIERN